MANLSVGHFVSYTAWDLNPEPSDSVMTNRKRVQILSINSKVDSVLRAA